MMATPLEKKLATLEAAKQLSVDLSGACALRCVEEEAGLGMLTSLSICSAVALYCVSK